MPFFTKAPEDAAAQAELDRLESLLSRMESRVRAAFAEFVQSAQSGELIGEVADRLEAGDIDGALDLIDSHAQRFASIFPRLFTEAGQQEAAQLAATLGPIAPAVAISFDPTDPAAALLMRENQLEFVRQFTTEQRAATRAALTEAIGTGQSRQVAARAFRESIGLTTKQAQAVKNYEGLLRANSGQALDRTLRDRRFDPTVERAISNDEPLRPEQIARMGERYRARMLAGRAETIARTESVRIMSQAREAAFRQTLDQTGIDASLTEQTWRAVGDARTRVTHVFLNGQTVPLGQAFQSISGAQLRYPGDPNAPADEVINCRCHRTFRIKIEALRAPLSVAA